MKQSYREETDQELISAARAAYSEAPPEHNTGRSWFAQNLALCRIQRDPDCLAAQVARADQRLA